VLHHPHQEPVSQGNRSRSQLGSGQGLVQHSGCGCKVGVLICLLGYQEVPVVWPVPRYHHHCGYQCAVCDEVEVQTSWLEP